MTRDSAKIQNDVLPRDSGPPYGHVPDRTADDPLLCIGSPDDRRGRDDTVHTLPRARTYVEQHRTRDDSRVSAFDVSTPDIVAITPNGEHAS